MMSKEAMKKMYQILLTEPRQAVACERLEHLLREALAEQPAQQEPVAWTLLLVGAHNGLVGKAGDKFVGHPEHYERVDVYTSPPAQRKPLTVGEVEQILAQHNYEIHGDRARYIVRMTEAAHGIKENT